MNLEQRIIELEAKIKALENTTTIPLPVEQAFVDRFNKNGFAKIANTGVGSFTQANLKQTIALTGNVQNIDVLELPTSYIPIVYRGTTYKIPIFVD